MIYISILFYYIFLLIFEIPFIFTNINEWACSSAVEQLTADQRVHGSNPCAPFFFFLNFMLKLKY